MAKLWCNFKEYFLKSCDKLLQEITQGRKPGTSAFRKGYVLMYASLSNISLDKLSLYKKVFEFDDIYIFIDFFGR